MKKRVISGLIMAAIIIPVLLIGGIFFDIGIALLAILAFKELSEVNKKVKLPTIMKYVGMIGVLLITFNNVSNTSLTMVGINYQIISFVMLIILIPILFFKDSKYTITDALYLTAITLFLGVVFNFFILIFMSNKLLFIWLIIIACVTDIFALLGGMLIGKHKLTKISPKKTWEGSIVGALIAVIVGVAYYMILIGNKNMLLLVLIVLFLSVIGQLGDLFFSAIKRENEIKDYSNLIPGHGGILDRIDNIIFVVIAFVFIMQFL